MLSIVIGTLTIGTSFGQSAHFGIKGGLNFSSFSGEFSGYDFENITNFHAGIFVELNPFDYFSIQPELLYSTQGARISGIGDQIDNKLGYLSLPVLARFYLIPDILSIDVGPQASVLLSEAESVDLTEAKTFDFAVVGGLTAHIFGPVFLQGRYVLGLTDVRSDAEIRNSVIQLSAGIRF